MDEYSKTYDNFILIGDFNVGIDENYIKKFYDINCLKTIIKEPKTLKNPQGTFLKTQKYVRSRFPSCL